jgi:formylmethanofuran dehydrogenase subunit E-like metal-binding protein
VTRVRLILCLLVCSVLVAGCEPLTVDELSQEAATIRSTAAEGALLAQGVAHDRSWSPFVRAHAAELGAAADTSARKLHDARLPSDLKQRALRAIALANQVSATLGKLELSPTNSAHADAVRQRLRQLATRAHELESRL